MNYFVVFKKQENEPVQSYSIVDAETFKTIPKEYIDKVLEVEAKLYTKEELSAMRDKIV